eukprot:6627125-Pyramimonas_sp.AAC.1
MDKGARICVQSPKNGPQRDHAARRVTTNFDDTSFMQAPLPSGVTYISTRLYWGPPAPALLSNEWQRPRPRRFATVDDHDRLPPPSIEPGPALP